jgi:hypothetical protein
VTFPLQMLAPAIEERAETWARLDMARRAFPIQPNHGKPVVRVDLESAAWLVQIMIWNSGEAELETIRLTDDRIVNKHYDLSSPDDLNALLDELARLLLQDQVPDRLPRARTPGATRRHGTTRVIRRRHTDRDVNPERGLDRPRRRAQLIRHV